jgi:hypothetical protein
MAISIAATSKTNRMAAVNTDLGTGGTLKIYSGTPPASADAALGAAVELVSLPQGTYTASSGQLTCSFTAATVSTGGTASFFRLVKAGGSTCIVQGTVTATGGGGDMTFSTVSFVTSATITLSSFVISDGN